MSQAHTPGPWRLSMSGYSIKSNSDDMPIVANNPWGIRMRERDCPRWIENAEFIVLACNNHYGLLAAVRSLVELIDPNDITPEGLAECRDAIAKAEGRS